MSDALWQVLQRYFLLFARGLSGRLCSSGAMAVGCEMDFVLLPFGTEEIKLQRSYLGALLFTKLFEVKNAVFQDVT